MVPGPVVCGGPELRRHPVRHPDEYGIPLPEWLRQCILNVPPGLGQSCPTDPEALLVAAFDFGFQLHKGQFRASGDPYIVHPVAVADLLRDIGASASVIAAGFLHDVVEDTDVTPDQIEQHFGSEVRELVEGVTKLGGIHFNNRTEAQAENLRRMFLAMASDIRVVLVKLADRLHNMRTLGALKQEKRQRIARETREIYAPLANRLGIGRFKWELEDLAFKLLEPEAFREIQEEVSTKRSEREQRLGVTVGLLNDRLAQAGLESCEVSGVRSTSTVSGARCSGSRRRSTRSTTWPRCGSSRRVSKAVTAPCGGVTTPSARFPGVSRTTSVCSPMAISHCTRP